MDHASLIGKFGVTSDQGLTAHRLSKDFDAQDIRYNFFRFPIRIGMNQSDVIIGGDDIAQSTKSFFNALDDDLVGKGIAQMIQFLIGGGIGDEQSSDIANRGATDKATACNGSVQDGNVISELGFQDGIKVFGTTNA
jgi:hypothetical protein